MTPTLLGFSIGLLCLTGIMRAAEDNKEPSSYKKARAAMVCQQLAEPRRDISDKRVLEAMGKVKRHRLVPPAVRDLAYEDSPLPIGHGQTISQPYIVALMTQTLAPKTTDKILEVGTGSGYQAAILAEIVDSVYTIEIVEPLAKRAKHDLAQLGYTNIFTRAGDGYEGWSEAAPFDGIIVTCAPEDIPAPLVEQLSEGGKMIIPVGPQGGAQELILLTKKGGKLHRQTVLPVRFVPMTGKSQR